MKIDGAQHSVICAQFKSGLRLRELAALYGVTRQRIQAILKQNGLRRADGGLHVLIQKRESEKSALRAERFARWNLLGRRFDRLTVIASGGSQSGHRQWECRCDCGRTTIVSGHNLKAGRQRSCGCFRKDNGTFQLRRYRELRPA
jgi:hypothetical protein